MSAKVNIGEQLALMIASHLRLDAAIGIQLKEVISSTEHAAMMLIKESRKLSDAAKVIEAKLSQQENGEDMRHYYALMIEHNTQLAAGIAEILGHTQFQDGVRQRIERMEAAIAKRNALFLELVGTMVATNTGLQELPRQMHNVLEEYLAIESNHAHSAVSEQDEGLNKFELF